jgi:hypothetical protein
MAKISSNNILTGTITSDKLDASVASNLASANNANVVATIASTVAAAAFASANTNAAILANSAVPLITTIQIADSSYNILDDTAANTTGGYVVITGTGFTSNSTVVFGSTSAPAVSYVSSTVLRAQTPALTAASYPVYVVNSNGGTAIKINGLTTSSFPAWSTGTTLTGQNSAVSFAISLSAPSDSNVTYSNTTVLPTGTTLLANGYFYGAVTVATTTTYSFTVKTTDVENQDASRTFDITVNGLPSLYVIGYNLNGQLGLNDRTYRSSPVQLGTNVWSSIAPGYGTTALIKSDGTLWTWGKNSEGQLGQNDLIERSSPVQLGTNTNWSQVACSTFLAATFAAIKTDGTLWTWGHGGFGRTAQNLALSHRSSPIQVGALTNWSKVTGSAQALFAIKTDGTLWAWGSNSYDIQTFPNPSIHRSSPTQIGAGTTWLNVSCGYYHMMATKTDGTLWGAGGDIFGQLGLNSTHNAYTATLAQVGADTTWNLISCSGYSSFAKRSNGTIWSWGRNAVGELGQNNLIYRSSPTQIGSGTNWSKLFSSGQSNTFGIKSDGTLWSWGFGSSGELGLNSTNRRSSPTQIGSGTNWADVAASGGTTFIKTI